MTQDIHIADAFADMSFTGNPAAVCVMEAFPADALAQQQEKEFTA